MWAALENAETAVDYLLFIGANVNKQDSVGFICRNDHLFIVHQ
jgi:hypothetical protein